MHGLTRGGGEKRVAKASKKKWIKIIHFLPISVRLAFATRLRHSPSARMTYRIFDFGFSAGVVLSLEEYCASLFEENLDNAVKNFSQIIDKTPNGFGFRWFSEVISDMSRAQTFVKNFKLKMELLYPHIGFTIKVWGTWTERSSAEGRFAPGSGLYKLKGSLLSP